MEYINKEIIPLPIGFKTEQNYFLYLKHENVLIFVFLKGNLTMRKEAIEGKQKRGFSTNFLFQHSQRKIFFTKK